VRAMPVVVGYVLCEYLVEVPDAEDQHAIEALAPDGAHDPFTDGVGPRSPNRGPDDLQALGGEHLIEAASEDGVTAVDQITQAGEARG